MEPPGPYLHGRPAAANLVELIPGRARQAAAAAAIALALTSSGEVVLLAVLLGVAAADAVVGATALVALLALAVRWGSTSLDAIAGAQAVLGPGAATGSAAAVLSAWCGAGALVAASPPGWPALAFGASSALVVAGPGPGRPADVALRVTASLLGGVAALVVSRHLPRRSARAVALALAGAALALALAS